MPVNESTQTEKQFLSQIQSLSGVSLMVLTRWVPFKDQSSYLNSSLSQSIVSTVLDDSYLFSGQIYDAKQNSAAFSFPYLAVKAMPTPTTIQDRYPSDWEYAESLLELSPYAIISSLLDERTSVSIRIAKVSEENVQGIRSCSLTTNGGFDCTHLSFRWGRKAICGSCARREMTIQTRCQWTQSFKNRLRL